MDKPKMLPCPHCGGNATGWHRDEDGAAFVKCDDCNAKSGYFTSEESARAAWNRRAPLPDNKALTVEPVGVYLLNDPVTERMTPLCCGCQGRVGRNDLYCKHCGSLLRRPPEKGD